MSPQLLSSFCLDLCTLTSSCPVPFLGLLYPFAKTVSDEATPVLDVMTDSLGLDGLSDSLGSLDPIGPGSDCVELDLRTPFMYGSKGVRIYQLYPCLPHRGFSEEVLLMLG